MTDAAVQLVDYLCETRHLTRDEQIKGIHKLWPDITPGEYLAALKICHAREFGAPKIARRRFHAILSRLKNKSGYMTNVIFIR
jgi:hypothetical protein